MSLYLEEARWLRSDQIHRIAGLNQKLVTSITLNAAIVGILGAALSLSHSGLPTVASWTYAAALGVFVLNCFVAAQGYSATAWSQRPDLPTLRQHLWSYGGDAMAQWTGDEIVRAIAANEPKVRSKARYVGRSLVLTLISAIVAGAAVALAFLAVSAQDECPYRASCASIARPHVSGVIGPSPLGYPSMATRLSGPGGGLFGSGAGSREGSTGAESSSPVAGASRVSSGAIISSASACPHFTLIDDRLRVQR